MTSSLATVYQYAAEQRRRIGVASARHLRRYLRCRASIDWRFRLQQRRQYGVCYALWSVF